MLPLNGLQEEQQRALTDERELVRVRILVVMPSIPLYGMERKTLNIMKGLREGGADILFITQKDHGQRIQRQVEAIGCRWTTASFDKLLGVPKSLSSMTVMLRAWVRSAWEFTVIRRKYKPTHIHITNLTYFLYVWPLLLRAREVVVFALPTPPDMSFSGYRRRLNTWIWRHVERVCDHLISNSEYTVAELKRLELPLAKVRVIHNCCTNRICHSHDAPALDRSRYHVGYVGQIRADKGVGQFVEAAMRLAAERNDVDFHLAGNYMWRNRFAEELMASVDGCGVRSRVRFHGEIEDVEGLLSQCDLHVCPSVWEEPFANVVLEAKGCGIPTVVFPSGGLPEMVNHLSDGYICAGRSAADLYNGIKHFLDRPLEMKAAGEAAKSSLSRFSPDKNAAEWRAVFKTSSTRRRARRRLANIFDRPRRA